MTNGILVIGIALLPSILLGLYIWAKDPQKEPTSWLVRGFLLGGALCIPVALLEIEIEAFLFGSYYSPSNYFEMLANAFTVAAIPEEGVKLLALWLLLRWNPYFDEHIDGIVYAVSIGIGFAAVENIIYLHGDENWITTAIIRSLLAVPGHYAYAVLMGYYYSLYYFVDHSKKNAACILLVPVLLHGIYDSLAMTGQVNPYVGLVCFFVLVFFCIRIHWMAKKRILSFIKKDREQNHAKNGEKDK